MPDETMRESDLKPHGSAGLANQSRRSDVEQVGAVYADAAAATQSAALAKNSSEWSVLMSGHAGGEY